MQHSKTTWWLRQGDKVFIAAALVVCTVAFVSFWRSAPTPADDPAAPPGVPARGSIKWPSFEPRPPDVSVDLATDADEYLPGPGEHVCVNPECPYLVPDGLKRCPRCHKVQDDRDGDGMDDAFELRHDATNPDVPDGNEDYDGDKFTNFEEYVGGSNPDDPDSIPAPIKLVGVGREFVDVMFRGFITQPDGSDAIQLNWGGDLYTKILTQGSTFRGYTIEKMVKRPVMRGNKDRGTAFVEMELDLILSRPGGGTLVLPRSTPVREPERYGVFASTKTPGLRVRAYPGTLFALEGHTYTVVAVDADSARLTGDRGEEYNLERRPE